MKKLLILLIFILFPFSSFAAFVDNNPDYVKAIDYVDSSLYFKKSSIRNIRYEPPFYIIEGDMYGKDYKDDKVRKLRVRFFYVYDKQTVDIYASEFIIYDNDGTYLDSVKMNINDKNINKNSAFGLAADYYFLCLYNMFFFK